MTRKASVPPSQAWLKNLATLPRYVASMFSLRHVPVCRYSRTTCIPKVGPQLVNVRGGCLAGRLNYCKHAQCTSESRSLQMKGKYNNRSPTAATQGLTTQMKWIG